MLCHFLLWDFVELSEGNYLDGTESDWSWQGPPLVSRSLEPNLIIITMKTQEGAGLIKAGWIQEATCLDRPVQGVENLMGMYFLLTE